MTASRRSLDAALGLLRALDANDAEAVRRWFAPGGTWWVDTGLDRAAGEQDQDPGADRPWPLHGLMDADEKCDLLRGVPDRFPGGVRQHVRRSFAGGDVAVVEVEGDGMFRGERAYRNRYCFVAETRDGLVTSLREYLDTAHSAAVFDGRHLDRRTEAPPPGPGVEVTDASSRAERAVVRFLGAIEDSDGRALLAACTPDATWWADGGRHRTSGPEAPAEVGSDLVVVGRVPVAERAPRIDAFGATYPDGFRMVPHRIVVDDAVATSGLVAVEARGHGRHHGGRLYQNRYVFVLRLEGADEADEAGVPLVAEVREYCDTRHAFDVYAIDR